MMLHDYTHCADYRTDCPEDCFRVKLEKDFKEKLKEYPLEMNELVCIPMGHFIGTEECRREE